MQFIQLKEIYFSSFWLKLWITNSFRNSGPAFHIYIILETLRTINYTLILPFQTKFVIFMSHLYGAILSLIQVATVVLFLLKYFFMSSVGTVGVIWGT